MASVIVSMKIMPTGPDVDLDAVYEQAADLVRKFVDQPNKEGEIRKNIEEIGFGLKSLTLVFVMDESIGGTEQLENDIRNIETVESVEVTDVRRAIG